MSLLPLAISFDWALDFDIKVFEWIQQLQTTGAQALLTPVLKAITYLGEAGIIWVVFAFLLFCTKKYRKAGVAVVAALAVMLVLNNLIIKELIARPRPFNLDYDWWTARYHYPEFVSRPDSWSFPSGHSSSSFAAAFACAFASKKKSFGIAAFILAFLMAFSRVYVEVHYCTDVIAGAIVGIIYGAIGVALAYLIWPMVEKVFAKLKAKLSK